MVTTDVETIDETRVKITITVEQSRVDRALDDVVRRLAGTVKVPGFRPGRVPRKVLESRLGKGVIIEEAARDTLPTYYREALQEHEELQPVGQPSFEVDTFESGADGVFHATVDIRPAFEIPAYEGVEIEHPEWELTEEEVQAQLDAMRDRFAEVETVQRPADRGDYVVVTITAKDGDTVVEEASAEDMMYQIPEEETDSELDRSLPGKEAGAIVTFTDVLGPDYPDGLAGRELSFTAIVKEVKTKILPDLDDEFALTASEFDTFEELLEDLRHQLGAQKRHLARANLRSTVVEQLAERVDFPLPASLVEEEQRFRLGRMAQQAEQAGLSFDQFLQLAGGGQVEQLMESVRVDAEQTVKAQLLIDAIGEDAEITIEQEDLGQEVARQALRLGRDPQEVAEMMLHPERIGALYADAFRRKTIDHLLASVVVLNEPPPEPEPEDTDEAASADEEE